MDELWDNRVYQRYTEHEELEQLEHMAKTDN